MRQPCRMKHESDGDDQATADQNENEGDQNPEERQIDRLQGFPLAVFAQSRFQPMSPARADPDFGAGIKNVHLSSSSLISILSISVYLTGIHILLQHKHHSGLL